MAYEFVPAKFGKLMIPTLLVMGFKRPTITGSRLRLLGRVLPNQTLVTLQGQGHDAIEAAPELFTNAVLEFLKSRLQAKRPQSSNIAPGARLCSCLADTPSTGANLPTCGRRGTRRPTSNQRAMKLAIGPS